jgi:hypothetical protein
MLQAVLPLDCSALDDRGHGPQVGEAGPEPIVGGQVGGVQLPRL